MIRYRRNISCLTTSQLHDLREALAILYALPESSPHSYLHVAGLHGEPLPYYCIHGAPGFLSWHRAYLLAFEEALQCLNPNVAVPYWNWSSGPTSGLPAPCSSATYVNRNGDTVPNPLYSGPLPAGSPGTSTTRRPDIDSTSFGDLAVAAQTAMTNTDFAAFQGALNGVHGSVHVRVGGNMSSVPYAGFDPIFYMHHANVDRLWALWQATHSVSLPPEEAALALDPFVKPCSTTLYTGADMQSTDALGYRYLNFCIVIIGPIVLKPIPLKLEPWMRERLAGAKLVLRSSRMQETSMELRVFVNQPDAGARTRIQNNPHYAGSFGIFGMGAMRTPTKRRAAEVGMASMPARSENFDLEVDITAALRTGLERKAEPTVSLVPVGVDGKAVPARQFAFDGLELHVQ